MKYTLLVPDDLLGALRERHALTYPEHRRRFAPWITDILARSLADHAPADGDGKAAQRRGRAREQGPRTATIQKKRPPAAKPASKGDTR